MHDAGPVVGPPVRVPSPRTALGLPPATAGGVPVLFMSSNGVGMGHLTRLLAIALRTEPSVRPVFLSLSRAAGVVGGFGLPWEHVSSNAALGDTAVWDPVLRDAIVATIDRWGVRAVVFDGVAPYRGLQAALDRRPDVKRAWVRRGLWRPGRIRELGIPDWFDTVVVPGELGPDDAPPDAPTIVGPVTLVDRSQLAARTDARRELGLPADARILLVAMGSGAMTDVATPFRAVMDVVAERHWVVARPRSPLPGDLVPPGLDVHTFEAYPMARLFPAFDAAIAASGYNSFHELVVGGVPSLFVPQPRDTDDQERRAAHAAAAGAGLVAADLDDLPTQVGRLLDDEVRASLRARLDDHGICNGADQAAAVIRELVGA